MRIACGWSHSAVELGILCFILYCNKLETGQLAMFGNRLGTGNSKDTMLPLMITMPFRCRIDSISCGSFHSAVLNELGQIFTWGCNFNGQLGLGHFKYLYFNSICIIIAMFLLLPLSPLSVKKVPEFPLLCVLLLQLLALQLREIYIPGDVAQTVR